MRSPLTVIVMTVLVLLSPLAASAQDNRAALAPIEKAMGAGGVKSIQYSGSGVNFLVGQNFSPGPAVASIRRQELHARR